MAREKEGFRDNLERLDSFFPGQELLNLKDVAKFLGIDPRSAKKFFSFSKFNYISKVLLARELS